MMAVKAGLQPIGPCTGVILTVNCSSTHNTLLVLQRTALGPDGRDVEKGSSNDHSCYVQTWDQLLSNVIDYITITLQFS